MHAHDASRLVLRNSIAFSRSSGGSAANGYHEGSMRALTLTQPWAHAITHLGLRVESRGWRPPPSIVGQRIAIHAGSKIDRDAVHTVERIAGTKLDAIVTRAVVATAIAAGAFERIDDLPAHQKPWWIGPYGWILCEVHVLARPVPCKGMLGLWSLPPDVEAEVVAQSETTAR